MSVYIGGLGQLIGLPYATSQSMDTDEQFTFGQSLEGVNFAQRKPRTHRTWSVGAERFYPNEIAALVDFANGSWGLGPHIFVSADASVTNLLTPRVAALAVGDTGSGAGLTHAGPVRLRSDETLWAPRSIAADNLTRIIQFGITDSPVIPGKPVTGAAWVRGSTGTVLIQFFNAAGTLLLGVSSPTGSNDVEYVRLAATAVAPAESTRVRLSVRTALQTARPTLTWTDSVREYADGQGCNTAVFHGLSRALGKALDNRQGGRFSDINFTVTEVGT